MGEGNRQTNENVDKRTARQRTEQAESVKEKEGGNRKKGKG